MKKIGISVMAVVFLATSALAFWGYTTMSAGELKEKLESKTPVHLVDIQVEEEFQRHHLPGAIFTGAYPVQSAEERERIDAVLPVLQKDETPVVVVCPGGGGGAKRAVDRLEERGIAAERLYILEGGQNGWPFDELVISGQ